VDAGDGAHSVAPACRNGQGVEGGRDSRAERARAAFGLQDVEAIPPSPNGANILRVCDYWVDADVADEGVIVTYFVA
jgi:hypothetical protein